MSSRPELLVLVPSRGRPGSVARLVKAWQATGAFDDGASLLVAVDLDDPAVSAYVEAADAVGLAPSSLFLLPAWRPMVHKLDHAARWAAERGPFALGFAGDDHVPRTSGWVGRYVAELRDLGAGIVYGDDGIQGERLPTQWAMTSDIVRALGRMVPADVEHLYCDNAILDLGRAADCIRFLPDVLVEHMHPVAGRAGWDEQYRRVNSGGQYRQDGAAYERWRESGLARDAALVCGLRGNRPATTESS